jgi:hypothetical protein
MKLEELRTPLTEMGDAEALEFISKLQQARIYIPPPKKVKKAKEPELIAITPAQLNILKKKGYLA